MDAFADREVIVNLIHSWLILMKIYGDRRYWTAPLKHFDDTSLYEVLEKCFYSYKGD